jgi:hypothetical protein
MRKFDPEGRKRKEGREEGTGRERAGKRLKAVQNENGSRRNK